MDRRDFLKTAGIGGAALFGAGKISVAQEEKKPVEGGIQKYNTLGRTGWRVGDVSMGGGGRLQNPSIVQRAVDLGINYFDTAPDYFPASEETLGKALPKVRDKVFIATKMCKFGKYPQHLALHTPASKYIQCVEDSLKRLQTDHVDVLFIHAIGERPTNDAGEKDVERLRDPEMLKATDQLKKQGKARFLATSSHGPYMMAEALDFAVECGHIDLIMPSWNFMFEMRRPPKDEKKAALKQKPEELRKVLDKAKEKNVAVVVMKSIPPIRQRAVPEKLEGLAAKDPEEKRRARLAAVKWALLSHPAVCTLVKTMKTVEDVDFYVSASGQKLTRRDQERLREYASAISRSYCLTGCGECADACPKGVRIPEIMRFNMYYEDYGHERMAMEHYDGLPKSCTAAACANCDAPCQAACPYRLPMKTMLAQAHSHLHYA
ncbi:MAG: twin-arginine translocation signal domain-containing protein [Planctomycetes bacterium]|nr:twin-arginine translocation signal domain-containing protein [Planctomycetota bacterium]